MKTPTFLIISVCLLSFYSGAQQQQRIYIAEQDSIDYSLPDEKYQRVQIKNKSPFSIEVKLVNSLSNQITGGFGLAPRGKTAVELAPQQKLRLVNPNAQGVELDLQARREAKVPLAFKNNTEISFTLVNTTDKPIPLIIPNVMNPNLSPFSKSMVRLEVGQKIYLKKKLGKQIIFEVPENFEEGTQLDVAALIKNPD